MIKTKLKTVFIGTPEFALPSLAALFSDNYFNIISVITKPDVKVGRKQELSSPPVKILAQKFTNNILQPVKITDQIEYLKQAKPDIIIVVAYAQIIPELILNIPEYGCINVHGSLLPKYRGASCIQSAIINGDKQTGITIMKMDKNLDTGPILAGKKINILPNDTAETLYKKLSKLATTILAGTIKKYVAGEIKPIKQKGSNASYCQILKKEDGLIDWNKPGVEIERFIRAMHSWPGAFTNFENLKVKIIETDHVLYDIKQTKPGKLFLRDNMLYAQANDSAFIIKQIQPEGKKILNAKSFINGYNKYIDK